MGSPEKIMKPSPQVEILRDTEAANEGDYGVLKERALEEMVTLLTNEKYGELETLAEKVSLLRTLILEKSAVKEGSLEPENNADRYLVEALAEKLSLVEKFEDEEVQALAELGRAV